METKKAVKIAWKNETRKVSDLIPADYNQRLLSDKEREDLTESIERFSTVEPVIVNIGSRNNVLIGGHQRTVIYADLGIDEIDVRVPNRELTIEEETELNLRLNKNQASWDWNKLKDYDVEKLLNVGFGDDELSDIFDDVGTIDDEFDEEKEIREIKEIKVGPGEIYKLGSHRLMIGDSTKEEDVNKLMGGGLAKMIYCDPPYNIGLDYEKGIGTSGKYGNNARKDTKSDFPDLKYKGFKVNDNKKIGEYKSFLDKTLKNALNHTDKSAHIFYWCDENYIWLLQQLFIDNAIMLRRVCMWIKNQFNCTPQIAFNKVYEPCVYGTVGRPWLNYKHKNLNEIMNREVSTGNQLHDDINDIFNVWLIKRDSAQDYEHPTQKPVTLHEKALKRCTAPGDIVIDLFGGSGSTLIACEQLNRSCYTMEMNPVFAQVIINRYEKNSGKMAEKIG